MRPYSLRYTLLAAAVGVLVSQHLAWGQSVAECPILRVESLEQLACLSWCELEAVYRRSGPGTLPASYARGIRLYDPSKLLTGLRTKTTRALWRGKHFCCDGSLINQWCGFRAIRAEVYLGTSWLDDEP